MIDPDSLLHQRFKSKRPGLELLAIEDAAVPVSVLSVDVLAQEKKALPLLHEFVLRLVSAGVTTRDEISKYLGLEAELLSSAIAEQVTADHLIHRPSSGSIALTDRGRELVRDLLVSEPVRAEISLVFDRLTWSLWDHGRSDLLKKREAEERGMLILPPANTSRIDESEVTTSSVNALLRAREGGSLRREVLAVHKVSPRIHRYHPVKVLLYGDSDQSELDLAVVVDGDQSPIHDSALAAQGGASTLNLKVAWDAERPVLESQLEQQRVKADDVAALRSATVEGRLQASEKRAAAVADLKPTSEAERSLAEISVRSVSVFEHRELLNEALENATRRLLIISPWVRSAVVDGTFVARLESRVRAGADVCIAYGIGKDDKDCDSAALKRLRDLAARLDGKFRLVRLQNSHAKVLIFDDKWVATSFNWLSFKGDPERTYRMEEGTLVRIPGQVTSEYERYLSLVEQYDSKQH